MDFKWFNAGFGTLGRFRLFNLFNRHTAKYGHWWGFGACQYGRRHLFFIGSAGISILWIGKTK